MMGSLCLEEGESLRFASCGEQDLPQLLDIQEEAFASLADASLLRRNSSEMLLSCVRQPHYTVGAWVSEYLVAFAVLYCPQNATEDLSLSLLELDLQGRPAANFKLCIVRPAFRGRALQLRLGRLVETQARLRGFGWLCATASPNNEWSCANLERQGFRLNCTTLKYGYERRLYVKQLD